MCSRAAPASATSSAGGNCRRERELEQRCDQGTALTVLTYHLRVCIAYVVSMCALQGRLGFSYKHDESSKACESMRRDTPAMQQHMRDHTKEIECLSRRAQ
jgi:hypothetical protein